MRDVEHRTEKTQEREISIIVLEIHSKRMKDNSQKFQENYETVNKHYRKINYPKAI